MAVTDLDEEGLLAAGTLLKLSKSEDATALENWMEHAAPEPLIEHEPPKFALALRKEKVYPFPPGSPSSCKTMTKLVQLRPIATPVSLALGVPND